MERKHQKTDDSVSKDQSESYSRCVKKTDNEFVINHKEHECHNIIEDYQQKYIYNFYDSYMDALNNVKDTKPQLLKRTFENYMESIENTYIKNVHEDMCTKLAEKNQQNLTATTVRLHKDHSMSHIKSLTLENYVLYKILYITWVNEVVKKDDTQLLSPCRIFIIQSIIKRRYQESVVFR